MSFKSLEDGIQTSNSNLNNIATLLQIAKKGNFDAAISLGRIFSRLMKQRLFPIVNASSQADQVLVEWMHKQYTQYRSHLVNQFKHRYDKRQVTALTILMHLNKCQDGTRLSWNITGASMEQPLRAIICNSGTTTACEHFVNDYAQPFRDVSSYMAHWAFRLLAETMPDTDKSVRRANIFTLLSTMNPRASPNVELFFSSSEISSKSTNRKDMRAAWMSLLRSNLEAPLRKRTLLVMKNRVLPWFSQPELLMDFLTDSYGQGGTMAMLSLSSMHHMMTERNLDYPSFYTQLYAQLDADVMHSKHRSRFFRQLNTFLSSTHLPSALVASFIKRLARLALHAPPAGIVAVIPWTYNMLKLHPTCTFMIHRELHTETEKEEVLETGFRDPFDMDEPDPMNTGAIDSSLWELESLQSHWHPNVSSLAKIMSQQFTKRDYNLEDFLDHSYNSVRQQATS